MSPSRTRPLHAALVLLAALIAAGVTAGAADIGTWRSIGPVLITSGEGPSRNSVGRVTSIAVDPGNPQTIYVGARGSGVWRTTDGGTTWRPVSDALPTLTVAGLAVAPTQPARVFLATPLGVYRSENRGDTWTQTFSGDLRPFAIDGGAMIVSPRTADTVFLSGCRSGDGGVQRSLDGGVTWVNTLRGCVSSLLMRRGAPNELVAGIQTFGGAPAGVYTTTDAGNSWRRLQGCPSAMLPTVDGDTGIRVAETRGRTYASFKKGASFRLFRTTTATCVVNGVREFAWEPAWHPDDQTGPGLWSLIAADPVDPNLVYATGTVFWVSTDGGMTFTKPSPQPHVDHHAFAHDPQAPGVIYSGNDGGIYRAVKGASGTWTFMARGIANVEFYDLADSAKDPAIVIGGTQDNGTSRSVNGDTVWRFVTGGDSGVVEIAPHNGAHWYEAGQAMHQVVRSTNTGASWAAIGQNLPEGCLLKNGEYMAAPLAKLAIDPVNTSRLLASCNGVWQGLPWTQVFVPPANDQARAVAVGRTGISYAGTRDGKVFASADGTTWVNVFGLAAAAPSSDVEPDPADAAVVYATFRTGANKVVRLTRAPGAALAYTANDITANLPAATLVNALVVDRLRPFAVVIATTQGVYQGRSADQGRTWTWSPYNTGLHPAMDVQDLEVHPTTGVMRAGTFGRGAYEVFTSDPIGSVVNTSGRVTLLRAHDVGTGFGPPGDQLDADAIVQLDGAPGMSFGFTLRPGADASTHAGMFDTLRDAVRRNRPVVLDYVRTGFRSGRVIRVMPSAQ